MSLWNWLWELQRINNSNLLLILWSTELMYLSIKSTSVIASRLKRRKNCVYVLISDKPSLSLCSSKGLKELSYIYLLLCFSYYQSTYNLFVLSYNLCCRACGRREVFVIILLHLVVYQELIKITRYKWAPKDSIFIITIQETKGTKRRTRL